MEFTAELLNSSPSFATMVPMIRQYATQHYNEDGWDFMVECWEDKDIWTELLKANTDSQGNETLDVVTLGDAIAYFREWMQLLDENRRSVMNEMF